MLAPSIVKTCEVQLTSFSCPLGNAVSFEKKNIRKMYFRPDLVTNSQKPGGGQPPAAAIQAPGENNQNALLKQLLSTDSGRGPRLMKPPMEEQMSANAAATPTTTQALPTPNTGGAPTQQQAAGGQMMAPAPPGFEGKNLVSLASQLPSDNISPIKTTAPISGLATNSI